MADKKPKNRDLTKARCRLRSPSGSGLIMSRQELAEALNTYIWNKYRINEALDQTYVGHLEQGRARWPRARRREAFRYVLGVATDKEIGFYKTRGAPDAADDELPTPPARQQAPVVRLSGTIAHRDLDELVADGARLLSKPSGETHRQSPGTSNALTTRAMPAPDETVIPILDASNGGWNSFSRVTSMLAQQRQAVAPDALLSLVEAHRDCLSTLFRSAKSDPLRTEIGAMLGEASIVASRLWSAQGNRSVALAHCAYASSLADRLGNRTLGATARIFESNLHSEASTLIEADGDVMIGLRLLEEAAALSDYLTAPARARIAAEQAQTYAALNLSREAGLAIDRAHEAAGEITPEDCTGLYSDWNTSRVQVYEGTCQLLLGEPGKAVATLQSVLSEWGDDQRNINVILAAQVDLASAYAKLGELEKCCSILGDTYEQLQTVGNLRGIGRARSARRRLTRWNSESVVQELDTRMAAA